MAKGKKQDSITFVKERFEEAEDWSILRQVQINRSFYSSKQWISWDRVARQVYVPELRPGEVRLTFNKIKPAILTLLSKLCKNRVQLEVKPDTNDIDRIETAKAGFKYLTFQWTEDKMDAKTRRLKFFMLLDGFPALKVYVDKNQGDDIAVEPDMLAGMEDAEVPTKTGKIVTVVRDQFSLYVDPNAESPEEIKWVVERIPVDVDQIEDDWGVEVAPEGDITVRNSFDGGLGSAKNKTYKHHAWLYDYWELPCRRYPNGRRIVIAGDKELENSTDPGEFPYILFPAIPLPGTAVATGMVTDLTTPQKSYNIKRTAEARILEEMGNPLWLKPEGSVDDEDLVNEIGGIVSYTPIGASKPERVQGATVDNGWQAAMERDESDMEDISGAHEISQGATPKGNNTLGGLQLQVEQDETKLALLVQSYEDGIKIWGEKVLRLVQKHFPEEQQLSIVGENGEIEAFTFMGADLTGGEVVDVVPGSSMPTLKAVQDEKVMQMYGAGLFNNPQTGQPDSRRVVRMLGESIATQYFDDTEQDENKALTENRLYQQAFGDEATVQALIQYQQQMQGYQEQAAALAQRGMDTSMFQPPQPPVKLPVVRDFYDHEVHIAAHNRYRKSDEYDELPPELQALVDQHVAEHQQALQAPQMQAQQQQAAEAEQQARQQAEEADKQHQHEQAAKMQDHHIRMQEMAAQNDAALQRQGGM